MFWRTLCADVLTLDEDSSRANSQATHYMATFFDGERHRIERDATGNYRVGASGGVMTLAPTSAGADAGPEFVTALTDSR